ncbi:MAG: iron ABC transporter permease [Rhodobacteraceae bacterium]|nr:iron ABC transporter permease [Paracoccaceae bacterium]
MPEQSDDIVTTGSAGWTWAAKAVALVVALIVLLPVATVVALSFIPSENIWSHLTATVLPRYFSNSIGLALMVGAMAGLTGAVTAWLVTVFEFPMRRIFEWALFMPLAVPAYIGAYALVDFFEYAGPFQTLLRSLVGWNNATQYFFPEIRSFGGATLVLTAATYPYVYLLARIAFREQSMIVQDVAGTLGSGPLNRFLRVGLPMIRPSLAVGIALVMMETVSDFGVVEYFAVQTLSTGIFSIWLETRNIGGAAQLALAVLALMLVLVFLERRNRSRMRFAAARRPESAAKRKPLSAIGGTMAFLACAVPFSLGFALPVGVIIPHAIAATPHWTTDKLLDALSNTLLTGGSAAFLTLSAAVVLTYSARISSSRALRRLAPVTTIGYAVPGAVLGLGLLIPVAFLDNALADLSLRITGVDPGLFLSGTAAIIILALSIRFFAIAHGAADTAMGRVPSSLRATAHSLGSSPGGAFFRVYLPLIKGSLLTALLLVFVDCVKELPATLLLRPFNFNTLATQVYEHASLEDISAASPAALLVTLVGICGVLLLARTNR